MLEVNEVASSSLTGNHAHRHIRSSQFNHTVVVFSSPCFSCPIIANLFAIHTVLNVCHVQWSKSEVVSSYYFSGT